MARYEGMDELLQRVQERLVPSGAATERPQPDMRLPGALPKQSDYYPDAMEQIMLIHRRASELRESLSAEHVRSLSTKEHEDLLRLLRGTLQELWSCESVLDRVAHES